MRAAVDLVCFDLDGTLVDSAPDLCLALGDALKSVGFAAPTEDLTREWVGAGIDKLLLRALAHSRCEDQSTFRAALTAFHASYSQNLFNRSRLYPGVESALDALRAAELRLCCITNKRADYALELLERAGIAERFEFTFGGDSFAQKKPHPRQLLEAAQRAAAPPQRCVMIGDSESDGTAATAAGFRFVWAAFGYRATLAPEIAAAATRVDEFAEIPSALSAMMPAN